MKEVLILADVGNLFYSIKRKFNLHRLNYAKFLEAVSEGKDVYKSIAYCTEDTNNEKFFQVLKGLGFEVKSKPPYKYQVPGLNGDTKSISKINWTARLTIDALNFAKNVNEVVIGSNNNELVDTIKYIKDKGVYVTIYACNVGKELIGVADNVVEIPEILLYDANPKKPTSETPEATQ